MKLKLNIAIRVTNIMVECLINPVYFCDRKRFPRIFDFYWLVTVTKDKGL